MAPQDSEEIAARLASLEERLAAFDRRLSEWMVGSVRALDKAESELDRRLTQMNEFRAQILTERRDFVTLMMFEERKRETTQEFRVIEDFISNLKGRIWAAGILSLIGAGIISLAVGLAIKYF